MRTLLQETSIYRYPFSFVNKNNEPMLIQVLDGPRRQAFVDMCVKYEPRSSFNGLPPLSDHACLDWATSLASHDLNLVALTSDQKMAGNASLFPLGNRIVEMLVFVTPEYQNIGVGTHLTRSIIDLSHELGFDVLRLVVDHTNFRAKHVYRKCGFKLDRHNSFDEQEMALSLDYYRKWLGRPISEVMHRDVVPVHEDMSCKDAVDILLASDVSVLPVVNTDGTVAGLLSKAGLHLEAGHGCKVRDIATVQALSIREDCTIDRAIRFFRAKKLNAIAVIDEKGKVTGVLGRKDILFCLQLAANSHGR